MCVSTAFCINYFHSFIKLKNKFMKKIYAFLVMVIALVTGAGTKSHAFNFTGHTEYDMCDSVNYQFTINAASGTLTARTFFGDGTSKAANIGATNGYVQHQFTLPGIYTVKHVLYQSGAPVDSVIFTDTIMCNNAIVTAFLDMNSNCTWDATEPLLTSPVDVEIDSAGVKIDTLTLIGSAFRTMSFNKTYSMKLLNLPAGLNVVCPTGGIRTATISPSGPTNFPFALSCGTSTLFDVAVNALVRVGRHTEMVDMIVSNAHCNAQTVTLTATLSPKYGVFQSAAPTPTSRVGNVLTWVLPNVSAFAGYHVTAWFERAGGTSTWLLPGDTVRTSFSVTPTTGDANTANNTISRVDTVRSSFDPNYKSVSPSGNIAAGQKLEYSIEFENDGNAPAENIHILDTLSANLDVNTLKVVSSTAPITNTSVIQAGSLNILRFDMPHIKLLDSSHHGECTGLVVFTIKAKSNLTPGTAISNRAGIYFDDNEVIMTNTAQSRIPVKEAVTAINLDGLSAYPNPVHDVLSIKAEGSNQTVQLISTLGQVVLEKTVSGKTTINVSTLPTGIYYLILKGQSGTTAQKIEKL